MPEGPPRAGGSFAWVVRRWHRCPARLGRPAPTGGPRFSRDPKGAVPCSFLGVAADDGERERKDQRRKQHHTAKIAEEQGGGMRGGAVLDAPQKNGPAKGSRARCWFPPQPSGGDPEPFQGSAIGAFAQFFKGPLPDLANAFTSNAHQLPNPFQRQPF